MLSRTVHCARARTLALSRQHSSRQRICGDWLHGIGWLLLGRTVSKSIAAVTQLASRHPQSKTFVSLLFSSHLLSGHLILPSHNNTPLLQYTILPTVLALLQLFSTRIRCTRRCHPISLSPAAASCICIHKCTPHSFTLWHTFYIHFDTD